MRKGRELERVVEALERCFAPTEADIKSPDSIPDRITGTPREIDVSIRYKVGTVPILVILECRDRTSTQDVTWIEQLAKKRDDVRASRAVAVSSSTFSFGAKLKAAHDAIELRTIGELNRDVVLGWCAASQTIGLTRSAELTHVGFTFSPTTNLLDPGIRASLTRDDGTIDLGAKVFQSESSGQFTSLSGIWATAVDQHKLFSTIPVDGSHVERKYRIHFSTGDRYWLVVADQRYEIETVAVSAQMWVDQTQHPISRILEYSGTDGTTIQAVEFEMPVQGKEFVLSLYSDLQTKRSGFGIRRRTDSEDPNPQGGGG